MIPAENIIQDIKLCIKENNFKPFKARQLEKKVKKFARRGQIGINPNDPEWAFRLCAAELMQGRYNWWGWECRSGWANKLATKEWIYPRWDGTPCKLLVLGEQGIGDEILFASAYQDLINQNPDVTFEIDDRLIPIFENSFNAKFVSRWKDNTRRGEYDATYQLKDHRGEYDAFIPAGNVPKLYRKKSSDFPNKPYLKWHKDKKLLEFLKQYPKPWVGVSWKGKGAEISPESLILEGTNFNLQYNDTHPELIDPPFDLKNDMSSLASFLLMLDHINATSTAVVHLAGALGVRVNLIKPPPQYGENYNRMRWYWKTDLKTDWYNSITIYPNEKQWKYKHAA